MQCWWKNWILILCSSKKFGIMNIINIDHEHTYWRNTFEYSWICYACMYFLYKLIDKEFFRDHWDRKKQGWSKGSRMAFTFAAFTYIVALIIDAFLIFFSIFHVSLMRSRYETFIMEKRLFHSLASIIFPLQIIAFDELKTDYKNPIDQCASLNPLVLPEYLLHILFNLLFLFAGEWFSIALNAPLIAYHIHRL